MVSEDGGWVVIWAGCVAGYLLSVFLVMVFLCWRFPDEDAPSMCAVATIWPVMLVCGAAGWAMWMAFRLPTEAAVAVEQPKQRQSEVLEMMKETKR